MSKLRSANWEKPDDVLIDFPRGSSLGQNGFIFRVGGNKWRILVKIDYVRQIVLIKEIGTHADYDDWEFEK
ncbi:type II toxin-antitoxin system HigB family toxin [bacterium]|nr:type II toxin-antitoxin system HigB family toxin [bacterium]MBU1650785.1 type II toxin-antitoxin system HigB family toxin [bacterium]